MNKAITSTLSYVFFSGISQLLSLLFMLTLMYQLDITEFSKYNVVVSLVSIFSFLIDGGLTGYIIKEYNKKNYDIYIHSEDKNEFITSVVNYQVLFTLLLISLYTLVAYIYSNSESFNSYFVFGLLTLSTGLFNPLFAIFLAEQKRIFIIIKDLAVSLVRLGILWLLVISSKRLELIYYIPACSFLVCLVFFAFIKHKIDFRYIKGNILDVSLIKNVAYSVLPFLLLALFNIVYNKVDILMLEKLSESTEVGFYAGATIFVYPFMFICSAASSVILPILTRNQSSKSIVNHEKSLIIFMSIIGLILSLVLFVFSSFFYENLFDGKYFQSLNVYRVLVWYLAVVFTYTVLSNSMIASGKVNTLIVMNIIMLICNVILNIQLIPYYGAIGAAWSTLFSEALILFFMFYYKFKLKYA